MLCQDLRSLQSKYLLHFSFIVNKTVALTIKYVDIFTITIAISTKHRDISIETSRNSIIRKRWGCSYDSRVVCLLVGIWD